MLNTTTVNHWLRYWQPRPQARLRLFCFPYAGGSAAIYRTWPELFPPDIEVCPVQLPGRENRLFEEPFSALPPLVEELGKVLKPFLDRPYAFFGHSMGALISFELTRLIRRQGEQQEPVHLYVSGHRAPHLPDPLPPCYHLPTEAFLEELKRLKGTPEEVLRTPELLELLLPLLRADFAVSETYRYTEGQPLACPVTALGATHDSEVSTDELHAWEKQTSSHFEIHLFPGDHFFLHTEEQAVIELLQNKLREDMLSLQQSYTGN
uniref:Thioesterase n=1 Tax=Thermosporothrix sp. COM3 TaxID=2490863 RepID=A0A455SLR2_9CHLR|nr:thioesterase [Thermosporothrix sp. COM3]